MRVFISYRRDDSMVTAALLYRELASRPEFADAFMDIDDIGYGDDFVEAIDKALHDAEVVVVVIGPRWTEMLQARRRGDDWVRHEVATALRLRSTHDGAGRPPLRVLPVLIGAAAPPAQDALPADLAPLARLGMLKFDERALRASLNTLLESIQAEDFEGKVRRLQDEQNERKRRTRAHVASVAAASALFLAFSVTLFDFFGVSAHVASATMLLARIAAPARAWSGEVVLVAIDQASERAVGRKFDSSWRAEHAVLIGHAASAGARVVAFDLFFEDPGGAAADAALQAALAETHDKMPVVFGVRDRGFDGSGAMLARFAPLARPAIACVGVSIGQAYLMPLAVRRANAASSEAASLMPALPLAAYSGGGRVELIDKGDQTVLVRMRPQRETRSIAYYEDRVLSDPQPGCGILAKGDLVVSQLIDAYDLPALSAAPQRVGYEKIVAGDPDALALLKDRIVLVGTLLPDLDPTQMPAFAADRSGVELFAAQIDAMTRQAAILPIDPIAEWALMSALALLGAYVGHRLRERPRALRIAALAAIAFVWVALSIAWYRSQRQLVGVPYDIAALAMGAWLANRNRRRTPA
jgi:CHASE2 domain-containing sensor protein